MRSMRGTLPLGLRARLLVAFLSPRNLFENVEEPEARLNLALLRTEDALLAGTATADDIFGAAPGAGSYRDARIGIAIVLHGSFRPDSRKVYPRSSREFSPGGAGTGYINLEIALVTFWAAQRPREIGGIAQKVPEIALVLFAGARQSSFKVGPRTPGSFLDTPSAIQAYISAHSSSRTLSRRRISRVREPSTSTSAARGRVL